MHTQLLARKTLLGVALSLACTAPAFSQANVSVVRPNTWEIGAFAGVTYGGTALSASNESRVMGGANVTYALRRWLLPYAEFSYFPGIPREQERQFGGSTERFTLKYALPMRDFHGGVHIRIPIKESKVVPYVVFGMGALSNSTTRVTAEYTAAGRPESTQLDVPGRSVFAVNGGGGLRFYVKQNFGFRFEAKVYKPTGDNAGSFGKVEGGIFYQIN